MIHNVPGVYAQESISELLDDIQQHKVISEQFWVNILGKDEYFSAQTGTTHFPGRSAGFDAQYQPTTHRLCVSEPTGSQLSVVLGTRLGSLKAVPKITCADAFGDLVLLGTESGALKLVNSRLDFDFKSDKNSLMLHHVIHLGGHALYTNVARFFPSGQVAISAGMDYSMKVWDLNLATHSESSVYYDSQTRKSSIQPAQTLRYQKGMVDDLTLIGRGRNLASLCRADAEHNIVLWEVGGPSLVAEYHVPGARCMALWEEADTPGENEVYDGQNKVLLVGGDKNEISSIDFRDSQATKLLSDSASAIAVSGMNLYWSSGSSVKLADLRMPSTLLSEYRSAAGPVEQLVATEKSVVFRDALSTYTFRQSYQPNLEIVSCEHYGVLVSNSTRIYNVGNDMREFHL